FAQGGPLARDSADLLFYSTPGSTGDTQVDHDDNGVDVASPRNGGVWSVPIELVVNGEPTGEGDPLPTTSDWDLIGDDDSDFTVDFGFVGCDGLLRNHPVTGELCWNDTGHESGEQAGYGLMLLGLGMLMVLGVEDWTRRRLLV
ncbi:MAG: hypothetical protein OEM97_10560, partial [Acidimicrobiia bacterium]|nr:hypothetical protein [Acidimicrobiia bacterium]